MHALSLEMASPQHLNGFLGNMVSCTTDLGTEFGLADCPSDALASIPGSGFANILADDGEGGEVRAPGSSRQHLFTRAMPIAGICHILDNLTHDLHDDALQLWPVITKQLSTFCALFTDEGKRERFVNTCCRNGQFEYLVGTFNKSFPAAVSWRWGTLIAQLDWVLDIEAKVKLAWNPARYGPAAAKKRRLNEESDFTRESFTSVLRDSRFWAWLHMCRKLQQGIERIVWRAESCPCHPCAFHDDGTRIARHHTEKSMWRKLVGKNPLHDMPIEGQTRA